MVCDVGSGAGAVVALRAGIDAVPERDLTRTAQQSKVGGLCHSTGNDVHATVVLGAGMFLAQLAALGALPGRVRLLFEPAAAAIPPALTS